MSQYPTWMTRRRWIAKLTFTDTTASLTGDQAAASRACAARGARTNLLSVVANGFLHHAEITSVSEREVVFCAARKVGDRGAALPVHLLLAVFKFDHLRSGASKKATELGAARIRSVLARRTEKHLAQAAAKRVERWRRIVREAAQQSRRSDVPEMGRPADAEGRVAIGRRQGDKVVACGDGAEKGRYDRGGTRGSRVGLLLWPWDQRVDGPLKRCSSLPSMDGSTLRWVRASCVRRRRRLPGWLSVQRCFRAVPKSVCGFLIAIPILCHLDRPTGAERPQHSRIHTAPVTVRFEQYSSARANMRGVSPLPLVDQ